MNELDQLIKDAVDTAIADASSPEPARMRTGRSGAVRFRVASAVALAAACIVAVALTPWSSGTDSRRSVLPSIETASAKDVLNEVARQTTDSGSGTWRYLRSTSFHLNFGGVRCSGTKIGTSKCVVFGPGEPQKVVDPSTLEYIQNGMIEMWSSEEQRLTRRQYASYGNAGSKSCLKPSASARCLGWERRMLDQLDPPTRFPSNSDTGVRKLAELAKSRNTAVKSAMSGDRFPTRGAALTAGEVAFRLLTNPVYDAANRARVIRAIGELPGSENLGAAKDSLGRSGVRLSIDVTRRPYGEDGRLGRSIGGGRKILAIFDVAAGQLLEFEVREHWSPVGVVRTVIDEQGLQERPTPTTDTVPPWTPYPS